MPAKKKAFVLPKTAAKVADLLYKTREERYAINKQAEEKEEIEKACRDFLIANLPKGDASGVAGAIARVSIEVKEIPQVSDWPALQAYIKKNDAFDLLQRRLSDTAVQARWDDKKKVPGVIKFTTRKVSCVKK
jgi:hypothetical protein